ncbi:MAG: RadC family protein [Spirochaetota bacterium]
MISVKENTLPVQKCISGESVRNLSDTELLSVIIGSGNRTHSVYEIASRLYYGYGGLRGIYDASLYEISETNGIGMRTAVKIASSLELGRRIIPLPVADGILNSPEKVWRSILTDISGIDTEIFIVLVLNTKNRIMRKKIISVGTVSETVVHPREIFREAIREGGSSIIVCHNHPSGDVKPSAQDLQVTVRLCDAGRILGITLLDHLIVTESVYYSMKEAGEVT